MSDRFVYHHLTYISNVVVFFIYSSFDMFGPYGVVLCCYKKRYSFFLKVFLS